jgi:hypothetical protein
VLYALLMIFTCWLILPFGFDAFTPSPDLDQNKCPLGRANDPIRTPRPNSGVVKIIRLTNDGAFVNRCEFTDALYELVWDRMPQGAFGPPRKTDATSHPRFTVLYVHGWKHGADSTDSDLTEFKRLIERLADTNPDRQVLGVYIAWNAAWGFGIIDNISGHHPTLGAQAMGRLPLPWLRSWGIVSSNQAPTCTGDPCGIELECRFVGANRDEPQRF